MMKRIRSNQSIQFVWTKKKNRSVHTKQFIENTLLKRQNTSQLLSNRYIFSFFIRCIFCFIISRSSNIPGTQFPTGRNNLLANIAWPKAHQTNITLQLLEHAILSIRTGLR